MAKVGEYPDYISRPDEVVCSAPVLENGYPIPSFDQYECGVRVTYACDEGYTLSGPSDGACGPDGQFVGQIPSCVKNDSPDKEAETATESISKQTATNSPITDSPITSSLITDSPTTDSLTKDSPSQESEPESSETEGGSSIYGIVGGAVGGMVFMALIGLTIFCIKRSKKNNPSYADTAKTQNTVTDGGYIGIVTEGLNGTPGNGLNTQADGEASEAGYTQPVSGSPTKGNCLYAEAEPVADRDTSQRTVTGDENVYSNLAYDDEYQEIKDALPNDHPYADVNEDPYEN